MKIELGNKVAVVTGGSGQLGRVICRSLAACGAAVAVHYQNNQSKADEVVADIVRTGGRAIAVKADITLAADVNRMRGEIEQSLGAASIVVTAAVIQYQWTSVLQQSLEDYESQFRSCVLHNVVMAQAFVPGMIAGKWGRIIGINTECAMQCAPAQSAYVSGKRAMDGVLRTLAREIGEHGITVNQIAPGWMISDKYRGTAEERQPDYESRVPLRRRGYDQDIANAVAFLASPLAEFISGVYLPVCGGNVMPAI